MTYYKKNIAAHYGIHKLTFNRRAEKRGLFLVLPKLQQHKAILTESDFAVIKKFLGPPEVRIVYMKS
jgi:hypothetical protein